jgi:gliding motility-associated-like protein
MRVIQFIIVVAIAGWCLSPAHASGNNVVAYAMVQMAVDSIIAPNVFTPNGDGDNDIFEVTSREGNVVSLKIYTRTGVLVFSIEAKRCCWDGCSLGGQKMANGVYYYTAEVRDLSPKISKSGFVHLYR